MSWRLRVRRRPKAESDIENQVDYYLRVEGVPDVALRFVNAIEGGLERLVQHPEIGFLSDLDAPQLEGLRQRCLSTILRHGTFEISEPRPCRPRALARVG